MEMLGRLASDLVLALSADDAIGFVVATAVVAAAIYLIATFSIDRARNRDDRRSSGDQRR